MWRKRTFRSLDDITKHDRTQLRIVPAFHNAIAIALPLVAGVLTGHVLVGVGIAIGALIAAFGTVNGTLRTRMRTMIFIIVWLTLATFVGALAGGITWLTVLFIVASGFAAGMVTAVSGAAAQIGVLTTNALIIISHVPQGPLHALEHALFVMAGGLLQLLLMFCSDWLNKSDAETEAVMASYAAIASYAVQRTRKADLHVASSLMEADNFLNDSYMRKHRWQKLRILMNLAELVRIDIVTLTGMTKLQQNQQTGHRDDMASLNDALSKAAHILSWASTHMQAGRPIDNEHEMITADLRSALATTSAQLTSGASSDAHLCIHQLYSKLAQVVDLLRPITPDDAYVVAYAPRRSPFAELKRLRTTLRANFTFQSTSFRHAIRLAAALLIAAVIYRTLPYPYGYWLPLTTGIILKVDFFSTLSRGIARVLGTVGGLIVATLLTMIPDVNHLLAILLIILFGWAMYTVTNYNFALFSFFMTAEIVMLLSFFDITPPAVAITARLIYTICGSMLAMIAYVVWPTWQRQNVPSVLADLIGAERQYFHAIISQTAQSTQTQLRRKQARLARTNAARVIDGFMHEPAAQTLDAHAVSGLLTALHRFSDTLLSLESGLNAEHEQIFQHKALAHWASQLEDVLTQVEHCVRETYAAVPRDAFAHTGINPEMVSFLPAGYLAVALMRLEETMGTMTRMLPIIVDKA